MNDHKKTILSIVKEDRVKILFSSKFTTLLFAIVPPITYTFVFRDKMDHLLLLALILPYVVLTSFRHIHGLSFWKNIYSGKKLNYDIWENIFAIMTFLSGLSFGILNYMCFLQDDILSQTFCIAMTLGYVSGCIDSFSSSMKTVPSFVVPATIGLILALIIKGANEMYYLMAVMLFVFLGHAIRSALSVNSMIKRELFQKYEGMQTSKMKALGEMASGMAHEINNPLTIVTGNIKMLELAIRKGQVNPDVILKKLELVSKNVWRITEIISDLRKYSREKSEDLPIDFEVLDLCRSLEERFSNSIKAGNFEWSYDEYLLEGEMINGRSHEIKQALINIISNAIDAIENDPWGWVKIKVEKKKGIINFTVTNIGKPIDEWVASKMMDPFFTTKTIGKGTGLGLSTAKGIVEAHEGNLRYIPSKDKVNFTLSFPCV